MRYFVARRPLAEHFELNGVPVGLQLDEYLFGHRVLDHDRADPEDVPDFLDFPIRGDLAGLPGQF
jgi:hypothetical protein